MQSSPVDALVVLGVFLGCLYLARRVSLDVAPGAVRLIERLWRRIGRAFVRGGWQTPVRRFGLLWTLWLWCVGGAVVTSVANLATLAAGSVVNVLGGFASLCFVWAIVAAGWLGLRWLGERRYTPRPLPRRQRR